MKKKLEVKHAIHKEYCKVKGHCHFTWEYRAAAHTICDLKCTVPKEILIVLHNRCNYDYHFIMKEFAEKFKK